MAVSTKDRERLNGAQQSAVQNYTDQYYEAKARGDKAGMQAAHDAAERVRNQAGYSGGADGSAGSAPSRTAAEMERDVQQFNDVNYDSTQGRWTNGYTTEHNVRTKANAIRQQMLQNSQNWHTAGTQAERDYLHQQNLELNRILSQYAGGVESRYDPATGRWTTENADLGYGDIDPYDRANAKRLYGVTDAELDAYLRNTDRYFNYAQQHPLSYLGRNGAEGQMGGSAAGHGYGSGSYGAGGGYGSGGYGSGGYGYGGYGSGELSGLLGDWRSAAQAQAERQIDYATAQGVAALERAREDAAAQYQTQRDQALRQLFPGTAGFQFLAKCMQQKFHHRQPLVKPQFPQLRRAGNNTGEHAFHIQLRPARCKNAEEGSEGRCGLRLLQKFSEYGILDREVQPFIAAQQRAAPPRRAPAADARRRYESRHCSHGIHFPHASCLFPSAILRLLRR